MSENRQEEAHDATSTGDRDRLVEKVQSIEAGVQSLQKELDKIKEGMQKFLQIAQRDPAMALVRARKILEHVVRDLFARHLPKERPGTQPLQSLIDRLHKEDILDIRIKAHAVTVCGLGNAGAHVSAAPEPTSSDVDRAYDALMDVLDWYFKKEQIGDISQLQHEMDASDVTVREYASRVRVAAQTRTRLYRIRRFGGLAVITFLVLALWAEHRFIGFGPPWPNFAACAVCTWLMMVVVWFASDKAIQQNALARRAPQWLIVTAGMLLIIFILLFPFLTIPAPEWPNLESRGLSLQREVKKLLQEDASLSLEELLEGAKFDPHKIWVPWTVDLVRVVLLLVWLALMASLAALVNSFWWSFQESNHDSSLPA
jgi:hypothetical protein